MYLVKSELEQIYNCLPEGDLKEKVRLQITVSEDTIEAIKKELPDVDEIYKDESSNSYIAKFYTEDEYEHFTESRCYIAPHIFVPTNAHAEIRTMDILDPEDDWIYSGYKSVWKKGN